MNLPPFETSLIFHRPNPKVNSRFEYPLEIDLEAFLDQNADRSEPHIYRLHSVIVLSGVSPRARWVSFIKPLSQTRWLKFDNTRVTPATKKEVLDDNYETNDRLKDITIAYMLVYIRESKLKEVIGTWTPAEIPPHLREW